MKAWLSCVIYLQIRGPQIFSVSLCYQVRRKKTQLPYEAPAWRSKHDFSPCVRMFSTAAFEVYGGGKCVSV